MKAGSLHKGARAIFNPPDVAVSGFYAIDKAGKPGQRLVQVDLAPDDPDDGSEEFRIASKNDPAQVSGKIVDLEPDELNATGKAGT